MSKPEIVVTDVIDEQMASVIGNGLDRFNALQTGYSDKQPLAVVVKHPDTGQVLGGALGRSSLGLLFLDLFYLPESLRGRRYYHPTGEGREARFRERLEEIRRLKAHPKSGSQS